VLWDGHQSWCPQIGQGKHRWAISAKVHPQPWNPVLDTLRPACGVRMMRASPCCEAISSSSCWLQAASVETGMGGSRTSSPNASSLPSVVDGRALKENTPEGDRRMCLKWACYHGLVSTGTANADTCHVQRHRWLLLSILASPPHSAYSAQERPTAEAASELLA
jgi:hypothetical protein